MKKWGIRLIPAVLLVAASFLLLKGDAWVFLTWWLLAALMGLIGMPCTGRLFQRFDDKGWLFSKVFAIAVTGFLTWLLVSVKIMRFTFATCVIVTAAFGVVCFFIFRRQNKKGIECLPIEHLELVYWEEVLFFTVFLLWTYLAGFHPAAYGTEKFMDYGFMEAMMRSEVLPARDLWYSEGHINYYYGGQYFAVFLTKLSASSVELTYNLMRTFVAGFAFVLPFSLVYQMTKDKITGHFKEKKARVVPAVSGLTAGFAVSIAGNMHYVIYAKIIPWIQKLQGQEVTEGYWFPDATRYIGFDPDVPDKTIHEFPCYSFVLGDLHAHVVNIMFVLLLMGVLYAWTQIMRAKKAESIQLKVVFDEVTGAESVITVEAESAFSWKDHLLAPHILLVSVLLGMFQWSNFWDYVIYFVVTGGVVLFTNIICLNGKAKDVFLVTAAQAAEVLVISYLVILPFTLQFKTMVQGVALTKYHSLPHQLLVLWGLPTILVALFLISLICEKIKADKPHNVYEFLKSIQVSDLFAVILSLCAIGLVLIPELVYVRDIYEEGNARANTMFKLTYQAYMMFGMAMGYVIYRMILISKQIILKVLSVIGLVCLLWTGGYFGICVDAWFGDVLNPAAYKGLNAVAYIETDFPEDAAAIYWLKENVKDVQVVLEANGDSYTSFERVSAMTGLPTVLGWYVHEWLWRNDVADLNQKSADITNIYTSQDQTLVQTFLTHYDVSYIFVGAREREKYAENLNHELLQKLGTIVFQDESSGTYIIKVG